MFKSYVYLEVRVLLSAVPGVFIAENGEGGPKDILSAKKEFLRKNNAPVTFSAVHVQPSVLHKVSSFVRATGGEMLDEAALERLTGRLPEPPDEPEPPDDFAAVVDVVVAETTPEASNQRLLAHN